jgi:hypothetical protein
MKLTTLCLALFALISCSNESDSIAPQPNTRHFETISVIYQIIATRQTAEAARALAHYRTIESKTIDSMQIIQYDSIKAKYPQICFAMQQWIIDAAASSTVPIKAVFIFGITEEVDTNGEYFEYGDINHDSLPEIPVGRLLECSGPVALRYVEKIKRFESRLKPEFLTVCDDTLRLGGWDPLGSDFRNAQASLANDRDCRTKGPWRRYKKGRRWTMQRIVDTRCLL